MKKKSTSQSAFFNLRFLIGLFMVLAGVFLALLGSGAFSEVFAQAKARERASANRFTARQDAPGTQTPDVVQWSVRSAEPRFADASLYSATKRKEHQPLTRYPRGRTGAPPPSADGCLPLVANRCRKNLSASADHAAADADV